MRVLSAAWYAKYHEIARQMFARLESSKDSPEWDAMLDKELSGFIRAALADVSGDMQSNGKGVAPGALTLTKSVLVEQMKTTGDCDIGGYLKDWLESRTCRIALADLGERDERIILTLGLSPAGEQ